MKTVSIKVSLRLKNILPLLLVVLLVSLCSGAMAASAEKWACIASPADGSTIKTGTVDLKCYFPYSGLESKEWIKKLNPLTVQFSKNGKILWTKQFEFSPGVIGCVPDTANTICTLDISTAGSYQVKIKVPGTESEKWEAISSFTVNEPSYPEEEEENPGYYIDVQESSFTVKKGSKFTIHYNIRCLIPAEYVFYCDHSEDREEKIIKYSSMTDNTITYTAVGSGKTKLHVYVMVNGKRYNRHEITITVTDGKTTPVSKIQLSASSRTLTLGQSSKDRFQLKATVSPSTATNKTVKWASSNTKIATVDQKGNVIAVKAGSCIITATATDGSGVKASCKVTVKSPVILLKSIQLSKSKLSLLVGAKKTLYVSSYQPSNATDTTVVWSSSNKKVATVDQKGKVIAISAGECKIIATAKDGSGVKACCKITVKKQTILLTSIQLSKSTQTLIVGAKKTLFVKSYTPSNATDPSVVWSSSNTKVATVDQNGKIVAVAAGKCIITATAKDGSGINASCVLKVK